MLSENSGITLNRKRKSVEPNWIWISFLAGLLIVNVFAAISLSQYLFIEKLAESSLDAASIFGISGDYFGFANSVFSALAFAMIIVTLWMQKYELSQQREELEITRDVMIQQQQEMKEQNESLHRQGFETTFFRMLELHGEIVDSLFVAGAGRPGRESFGVITNDITREMGRFRGDPIQAYHHVFPRYEEAIGHYYRTLYNILTYVDENGVSESKTYVRLVRAQLSSNELILLTYNCLSDWGREKFKPLVEKYAILKHLRRDQVAETAIDEFASSAFGEQDTQ